MNINSILTFVLAGATCTALAGCAVHHETEEFTSEREEALGTSNPAFLLQSPDFAEGEALPYSNTCEGNPFASGVSPELNWTKGPKGTKSYAIVFVDTTILDAGEPNFAFHWAIWNIKHSIKTLPAGIMGLDPADPAALYPLPHALRDAQQSQARGIARFFGPCPAWQVTLAERCGAEEIPPRATDSYSFIVYALPDHAIEVPAHDPAINPNYVDRLNTLFDSMALGKAVLTTTSDAVPSEVPFPCP